MPLLIYMKTLGVIFGGVTCEHDVSIVSGLQLIENADPRKYDVKPIYIHSDGMWYTGEKLLDANIYKKFDEVKDTLDEVYISPTHNGLFIKKKGLMAHDKFVELDCVIPVMHGMNGEDGTLQGLLELANIPYSSSGVLGASVGMDKIIMKKVFEAHNLPVLPYTYFYREEWVKEPIALLKKIEVALNYPMFVKPANLGSSIGISKAKDQQELAKAIEVACSYDSRIVVEKAVENLREINCSALGYQDDVEVSCCEEPLNWKEFLTFEDKYLRGNSKNGQNAGAKLESAIIQKVGSKQSGMASMDRKIPAELNKEDEASIKQYTASAFKALNSKGVVRVDYIIDKDDGNIYVNEINTIPGSMAFYLWKHEGYEYSQLIDKLVNVAVRAAEDKKKNNYTFESNIIGNITEIKK